jgi:hypothetical protein
MIFKYKSNNIWPFIATRRARAPLARATGTVGVVPRFSSSSPRVTRVCCFSLPSLLSSQILLAGCPVVDGASSRFPPHRSSHLARPGAEGQTPLEASLQLKQLDSKSSLLPLPLVLENADPPGFGLIPSFGGIVVSECTRDVMLSDSDAFVDPSFGRCVWGIRWLCSEQG